MTMEQFGKMLNANYRPDQIQKALEELKRTTAVTVTQANPTTK